MTNDRANQVHGFWRLWAFACQAKVLLAILATLIFRVDSAVATELRGPNVLLCVADDASWPHCGAYGCRWVKTPGFDRVAREGLLFTRAYTPNAKCAPSRACILTGRNSWQLKEACNHMGFFPPEFTTFPDVLSEQGYFAGKTGKGWGPGVSLDARGKPRELIGPSFDGIKTKPPTEKMSSLDYAANFAAFLDAKPKDKPFFFWYGSMEPHRDYERGSAIAKGGRRLDEIDRVPAFWPDTDEVRRDMLDYAFEFEYFDSHLARMLDLLQKRNELENTLVVVTSDNGMPFPRCKGQVYEYSNHMPLAIMWKKGIVQPGRVVDDFVSFIDLAPTFLVAAKVAVDRCGMAPITGRSLTDVFDASTSGSAVAKRDHVLLGKERHDVGRPGEVGYPIRAIVKGDLLYRENFDPFRWPVGNPECGYPNCDLSPTKTLVLELRRAGKSAEFWQQCFGKRPAEELYDVRKDPDCVKNLTDEPAYATKKLAIKEELHRELKQQADPRMEGRGRTFDEYPFCSKYFDSFYERRIIKGEKIPTSWVAPTDYDLDLKE